MSLPTVDSRRRLSRRSVVVGLGWRAGRFGFGGITGSCRSGSPGGLSRFDFPESLAPLLAELFEEAGGLLKIIDPLAHERLQSCGDINRSGLTPESLAQAERKVACPVVGGASTGKLATAPSHDDEATVKEALGSGKQFVEATAHLSFGGGQGCRRNVIFGMLGHSRKLT